METLTQQVLAHVRTIGAGDNGLGETGFSLIETHTSLWCLYW